ncbi:hypothetical protein [Noviherbaspirillum sedimenti]|nr:hypothetical protein [Noviherbaspirillum sedimenti]
MCDGVFAGAASWAKEPDRHGKLAGDAGTLRELQGLPNGLQG